jgi:prepilin-type N-terminal cleavage/methylation domain-containing protein
MVANRKHRSGGGFTLVELLVVIGIIAVLVAILLPALQRAKQQAVLVECAARLRDVVTASHVYAVDNKGWLPPTRGDYGQDNYDYSLNFRNNHGWPNSATPAGTPVQPEIRSNIGRLIFRKYLSDDRMTRCPLALGDTEVNRSFDQDYCYNVHVKVKTTPVRATKVWWQKVAGFGKTPHGPVLCASGVADAVKTIPTMDRALVCDQMGNDSFGAAAITHTHGQWKYYNLGFIDGSVRSAKMRSNITRDPLNKWARFEDMLGYCEAIINGTATALPGNNYGLMPIDIN